MATSRRVQPARACRQQRQQQTQRPSCAGCKGTYTPYRINLWGLKTPTKNREDGRQMVEQQLNNALRHLEKVHGIIKHQVTEDLLPKRTPPFPEMEELLTLRKKVGSLERDIGGLEAIVLNLDNKRRRLIKRYERLDKDYDRLDEQLEALYDNAANGRPFVSPNGPDEDELPGISALREVLQDRENWVRRQASCQRPAEETGEEGEEEEKGDDSDVELAGVEYYPPPPASLDELEEEQQDEGSTAPVGEQEKEEEQQPPAPLPQGPPPPSQSPPPPSQSSPPSQSPPPSSSTNYSVVDMELTPPAHTSIHTRKQPQPSSQTSSSQSPPPSSQSPPPSSQSPPPSSQTASSQTASSQSPPSSTNHSVVDMELTPPAPSSIHTTQPAPPSQGPPPPSSQTASSQSPLSSQSPPSSSQTASSTNHSVVDMELTAAGPSTIHTRKRQLEPEEEDQLPEEFHPLAVSTPNDPQESDHSPAKRCRLATCKRPAYEPASEGPSLKRSAPVCGEEHELTISWSLTDEEERLNLLMAKSPPLSPRTRLWMPAPPRPPPKKVTVRVDLHDQ